MVLLLGPTCGVFRMSEVALLLELYLDRGDPLYSHSQKHSIHSSLFTIHYFILFTIYSIRYSERTDHYSRRSTH